MLWKVIRELFGRRPSEAFAQASEPPGAARLDALGAEARRLIGEARYAEAEALIGGAPADLAGAAALVTLQAQCRHAMGDVSGAALLAREAIAREKDSFEAHNLLARIELGGPHYLEVLASIHRLLRPRTYVEIGVEHGAALRLALPETRAIGIDPQPQIEDPLPGHVRLFRETSDDFFARHDLIAELGGERVELAFIDGMHHFEFALRDFLNLERHCAPGAAVLLHDCYPLDAVTSARERSTRFWSGDVWRAALALRENRPDLAIHTLAAPPTGLLVARNLDPRSALLRERYAQIVAAYRDRDYATLAADKPRRLNLVAADGATLAALFAR
jgi:hypothetical protein